MQPLNIGTEKALEKILKYCNYQERNHMEVREKLFSYGLYKEQVEELISQLIAENHLNEERYAIAFVGGKFRMKSWGRIKIRYELKKHQVSDYCIKKALSQIDEDQYLDRMNKLFTEKATALRQEKNFFVKKKKIMSYLQQKGYESSLISDLLKEI